MLYDWYWEPISDEKSDQELLDIIKKLKKQFYPHEDVYFRKVNFVYRFFQPYLVDEACIVTKDMVTDLLGRCDEVIEAAKEDGVIGTDGEIDKDYWWRIPKGKSWYELSDDEQKAEEARCNKMRDNMPTNLNDVLDCKKQFEKLLADWKDDEVVYNIMSW